MSAPLDLKTDWHIRSDASDGAANLADVVRAAAALGLHEIHLADAVTATTTWAPEYAAEVRRIGTASGLKTVPTVTAALTSLRGGLDLPTKLDGIARVAITATHFPTWSESISPTQMHRRIAAGEITAEDAVADLLLATARAVVSQEEAVVSDVFSLLPRAGIDTALLTQHSLAMLATACRDTGAVIEVNERAELPGPDTVATLCGLAVELVPASGARALTDIARWHHVSLAAQAIAP
ncbi:MAG: hypothetical protein ACK5MP_04120 [Nostocoides sp.]